MTHQEKIKVQLTLFARRLKNVAGAFKGTSDPYCVVTLLASDPQEQPVILGKTEVIKNSLSPAWTTAFMLDYEFGKPTRINVGIYDEVRKTGKNKPMGSAMFEIGQVLGTKGNVRAKVLRNNKGVLYARIERAKTSTATSQELQLQLKGTKLRNVDGLFGKSDPFVEISRRIVGAGHGWEVVYRSKPIMNNLNPSWPEMVLELHRLCQDDLTKPVLVSVLDWEKSGRHTPMGFFETSVNGLLRASASKTSFELKRKGKSYGKIVVAQASIRGGGGNVNNGMSGVSAILSAVPSVVPPPAAAPSSLGAPPFGLALDTPPPPSNYATQAQPLQNNHAMPLGYNLPAVPPPTTRPTTQQQQAPSSSYTSTSKLPAFPQPKPYQIPNNNTASNNSNKPNFVDYISGACELQMCVAIDFTGSNGDPRKPGTLHYIHRDGQQLNDYEKALTAVGEIVARYDSDQKFPVWGFGAKYSGILRHCFQVGPHAEAHGLGAVLEGYRGVFKTPITMSGPTVFTEVIEIAAAQARSKQQEAQRIGQQAYSILLILTDGAVSDVQATKAAIRAASDAPLSIVIVGIGSADFGAMQFLDDFSALDGSRDICQFVEFRRHAHNKMSLTQATLDEIPQQLVDYFFSRGIMPPSTQFGGSKSSLVVPDAYNPEEDIDLTVDIHEGGSMHLENATEGIYDDTAYGNLGTYADVPVLPPPIAPSASQPYNPAASSQAAPHNNTSFHSVLSAQQAAHKLGQPYNHQQQPVVQATALPPSVFYVRLPPNVTPGMQIQVQNPNTHQNMIVTVPPGITPGGTFPVSS